jgi:hypothetical protein
MKWKTENLKMMTMKKMMIENLMKNNLINKTLTRNNNRISETKEIIITPITTIITIISPLHQTLLQQTISIITKCKTLIILKAIKIFSNNNKILSKNN